LWGGRYNPIIPWFKQVPKWWDRHDRRFETAAQIVNGYLDFFEPDFIVEAEPGIAEGLGFHKDRVLQLESLLSREDDRQNEGTGLTVLDLYRDLYNKEFQFARRHKHSIIDVVPQDKDFKEFCACIFGGFPTKSDLKYLSRAFTDAFAPKKILLNGPGLAKLYKSRNTSALRIGFSKVKVSHNDHSLGPELFVLDAHEPRDLIDFWNLRAIRRNVISVPIQWIGDLSKFCKNFIVKNYRPLPGNPYGVMIHTTVMFSRSIPTSDIEQLYKDHFLVEQAEASSRQDWYPKFWLPSPEIMVRVTRPTLSAAEKRFEVPFIDEKPEIHFEGLHPDFAGRFGNEHRWANVVRLGDWTFKDRIATAFPCDYKDPAYPKFFRLGDFLLPTTEGFVIFGRHKNMPERWVLPDGTSAITEWLETRGIKAALSDEGRATQQIIQTLGGFRGVSSFASRDIVQFLNEMSRRPISRSAHHLEFKNRIKAAIGEDIWARGGAESLIEGNAVELGLELKCTKCSSWSWYSLKQLDYEISCSLCLRKFGFPIIDPGSNSKSRWAYRLIGPFALPNYASGGYAASLSIRFFADIAARPMDVNVTWSAGQKLDLSPNDKVEVDFILWYQRKEILGNDYPTELVIGEAKSFKGKSTDERRAIKDNFKVEDIDKMMKLATRFPGSILVFSTMKQADELSKEEIKRITRVAEWGREYVKERHQTRAPVIVLTGTELFTPVFLQEQWKNLGGMHAKLIEPAWVQTRLSNLRMLADLTQQLYLKMPSYGVWRENKWRKRAARRRPKHIATAAPATPSATAHPGPPV
jgi:hypothetical protein